MSSLKAGVLSMLGIVSFVFVLATGLSWYCFEHIDWSSVLAMALILLPITVAASLVVLWSEHQAKASAASRDGRSPRAQTSIPAKSAGGGLHP